jgi:hypothetical protein
MESMMLDVNRYKKISMKISQASMSSCKQIYSTWITKTNKQKNIWSCMISLINRWLQIRTIDLSMYIENWHNLERYEVHRGDVCIELVKRMTRSFFRAWIRAESPDGCNLKCWIGFFFQRRKATILVAAVMRAHLEDPGRPGAAGGVPRRASCGRGRQRSRARPGLIALDREVAAVGEQDVDAPPVRRAEVADPWPPCGRAKLPEKAVGASAPT